MIAVLFCADDSIYKTMPNTDCYDKARNALTFTGPGPVVAHPPCQLWGKLGLINYKRWGGDHNRPGNDGGLFQFALAQVRRHGGVLEHPADTYAWPAHGLCPPPRQGWGPSDKDYVCEVWQSAYGHRARKRTWLYYHSPMGAEPLDACWDRFPGTHRVGHNRSKGGRPRLSPHESNATPPAFAAFMLALAAHSVVPAGTRTCRGV